MLTEWAVRLRHGRDPRQVRYLTAESVRWVVGHRALTPWHLVRYWRLLVLRLRHPLVVTTGMVFLGRGVEIECRPGYGRIVLGRWVHLGDATRLRAHEGTLTIGDKCALGRDNTLNCYLDVEIGGSTLVADWVYVTDFDHVKTDPHRAIRDQGIVKSPVRIGPGSWLGVRTTVLRGTTTGRGCVLAAHTVARGSYPDHAVVAGVPGRVVGDRDAVHPRDAQRPAPPAGRDRKRAAAVRRRP